MADELTKAAAENSGLIWKAGTALFGAGATVFGWLFGRVIQKHDQEIASIKGGIAAVDAKLDGKVDKATWEQNRREARDNVIELHRKVEQIGRDGEERHRELMNILLEQRSRKRAGD